jgi:hypothetical protein
MVPTGMTSDSLLKVVRETGELMRRSGIFDSLPYYVCRYTDLLVWCCDSLRLVLKLKALVDLKGMKDMVICHLRPLCTLLVVGLA